MLNTNYKKGVMRLLRLATHQPWSPPAGRPGLQLAGHCPGLQQNGGAGGGSPAPCLCGSSCHKNVI